VDHSQLARAEDAICRLNGEFTLGSGQVAKEYFDSCPFESGARPYGTYLLSELLFVQVSPHSDVRSRAHLDTYALIGGRDGLCSQV